MLTTAAAAIILCAPAADATSMAVSIRQQNREFLPRSIEVASGTTIDFENQDDFPHQIRVSGPGFVFDSKLQNPDERVAVTLSSSGLFEVRCGVHPRMRLAILVKAVP